MVHPCPVWKSPLAVSNAKALLVSSLKEGATTLRGFPECAPVVVHHYGCEVTNSEPDPDLFRKHYDLGDYLADKRRCSGSVHTNLAARFSLAAVIPSKNSDPA
jgi:hypothetical protein